MLTGKIKELIKRYKSKIFEITEFKQLRDTFLTLKKNETISEEKLPALTINPQTNLLQNKTELDHQISLNLNLCLNLTDFSINKVTKDLLLELRNIKKCLTLSSLDIEEVFKYPLTLLNQKTRANPFNIKDIHMEEYTKTLLEDEFISGLINLIKIIFQQLNNEEITDLIATIEEDRFNAKREMTRLIEFLEENPQLFIDNEETKLEEICSLTEKGITKEALPQSGTSKYASSQILTQSSGSSEGSTLGQEIINNQPMPSLDIDELVKFIENEENIPKKSKKKSKTCKKKKEKDVIILEETQALSTPCTEYDNEVEQFKQTIAEWSLSQASKHKIKPQFTKEWLKKISIFCQ